MDGETEFVTVYRSADSDADRDAAEVQGYLAANGVRALIFDSSDPGVVQGSYEVRVASSEALRAEELLASYDPDALQIADPSAELDRVVLTERMGATAEMEVMSMKGVLDDAGIDCVIIGDSTLPNLSFQLIVARADADQARMVLAEAEAGGPAAALEAERDSEMNPTAYPQA